MTTETARESLTIDQFIERHGITLTATPVPLADGWEGDKDAQSWRYTLKCGTREMSGTFTKGSGLRVWRRTQDHSRGGGFLRPKEWQLDHKNSTTERFQGAPARRPFNASRYDREAFLAWTEPERPTAAEVLDSLASDVSSIDQPFEEWASDYGYDTDSRKAERIYNACRDEYYALRTLLGSRDLGILLNNVERM